MTYEKVRLILASRLEIAEETITPEKLLRDDLGVDSIDTLDLLMDLEEAFDIDIPDKKAASTVAELVEFIELTATEERKSA